ncbi:J domain-containing protein [Sporobolomyces koalae]|uniref:J domain-containing protein n=1 Tax=Sporobolomyces koalae TaxID=500713 RepID=UPI00316FE28E
MKTGGMSARGDNGITAHITSIICWTFLPSVFTNLLLSTFYRVSPASRPTLPPNASPTQVSKANSTAQRHFRYARIALVSAYLTYSVFSVYQSQSSGGHQNYYTLLGLSRDTVELEGTAAVKSQWRRLARIFHPDKVGKQGEALFVELRRGVEILENDGKRWAYERFGPGIADWDKLVTNREFLVKGATNAGAFWVFALLSIAGIGFFRKDERRNNFWRYLVLGLCVSLEFHFLFRPAPSATFSFLFPNRLTFEHIILLRQLFISISMAMSQLSPILFPLPVSAESSEAQALQLALEDAERLKPLLSRIAQLQAAAEIEAVGLQHLELRPLLLQPDSESSEPKEGVPERQARVVRQVKEQMVRTFEDLRFKSNPVTGQAWEAAVKSGRTRTGADTEDQDSGLPIPVPPFESLPSPPTSPPTTLIELEPTHKDEPEPQDISKQDRVERSACAPLSPADPDPMSN